MSKRVQIGDKGYVPYGHDVHECAVVAIRRRFFLRNRLILRLNSGRLIDNRSYRVFTPKPEHHCGC